jgi:hypothetical protein
MDAKRAPSSQGAGGEREVEHYGPLELRRLSKDDGRRLIAYWRAPARSAGADTEQDGESAER